MDIYSPGLFGIVGPMFSGKTDEMIRRLRHYKIAKMPVQAFRYAKDTRYDDENMASQDGNTFPAVAVTTTKDIIELYDPNAKVYAFDEVQFLDDKIIEVLKWLAFNRRVIYNGLDRDFKREWFRFQSYPPDPELKRSSDKTMKDLMDVSGDVETLTALCETCGKPAEFSQRLIDGKPAPYYSPLILIGSKETYEARCGWHHEVPDRPAPQILV